MDDLKQRVKRIIDFNSKINNEIQEADKKLRVVMDGLDESELKIEVWSASTFTVKGCTYRLGVFPNVKLFVSLGYMIADATLEDDSDPRLLVSFKNDFEFRIAASLMLEDLTNCIHSVLSDKVIAIKKIKKQAKRQLEKNEEEDSPSFDNHFFDTSRIEDAIKKNDEPIKIEIKEEQKE